MEKCYKFKNDELNGLYGDDLRKFLVGKVATCKKCASQKVRIERWCSPEYKQEIQKVSCGAGCGCTHNISGYSLEDVLNEWNEECDAEGFGPDYALEVVGG